MARRKADVGIGYRAAEEAYRIAHTAQYAAVLIGCSHKLVYAWSEGNAPTAIYLQRLCDMGADVLYILTGKRTYIGG